MKTKSLLTANLGSLPSLHLGGDVASTGLGEHPATTKLDSSEFSQEVTEGSTFESGSGLERLAQGFREINVDPFLCTHVSKRVSIVATNPEKKSQTVAKNRKNVDNWPQTGHVPHMPKETPNAPTGSPYEDKRHRFYMEATEVKLLDEACRLNGLNRSQFIARASRNFLKQNVVKLRNAGVKIPKDLLVILTTRKTKAHN